MGPQAGPLEALFHSRPCVCAHGCGQGSWVGGCFPCSKQALVRTGSAQCLSSRAPSQGLVLCASQTEPLHPFTPCPCRGSFELCLQHKKRWSITSGGMRTRRCRHMEMHLVLNQKHVEPRPCASPWAALHSPTEEHGVWCHSDLKDPVRLLSALTGDGGGS